MTVVRAPLVLPDATRAMSRLRRAALLLGVLPTVAAILVITLGPRWMVADGLAAVADGLDRSLWRFGWSAGLDQVELLANVAMFVPLGASLGAALRPRSWPLVVVAGGLLSVGVELAQDGLPGRVSDLRDVLANLTGDLVGLLLAAVLVGVVGLAAPAGSLDAVPARPVLARPVGPRPVGARRPWRPAVVAAVLATSAAVVLVAVVSAAGAAGPGPLVPEQHGIRPEAAPPVVAAAIDPARSSGPGDADRRG